MTGIVKRLGEYMKAKNLNSSEVAAMLDYASSEKISRLFRIDNAKPSADIIEDITNKFVDLNIDWWISGRGSMFKEDEPFIPMVEEPGLSVFKKRGLIKSGQLKDDYKGVPIYNVPVDASFLERFRDESYYQPIGFLNIPKLRNCDFASVISGNSMYPVMKSGSIVFCRIIHANLNADNGFFEEGEMYFVSTTNGFETVKYVQSSENADELLLIPHNDKIKPSIIKKSMVLKMCVVEAWLNFR